MPGTNTSVLQKFVNYGQKSFITLGPGVIFATLHFLPNKIFDLYWLVMPTPGVSSMIQDQYSTVIVSSRHDATGFVTVWYHHDTDSGELEKNCDV